VIDLHLKEFYRHLPIRKIWLSREEIDLLKEIEIRKIEG